MTEKPATARETYEAYLKGDVSLSEVERRIDAWDAARAQRARESRRE